MLSQKKETRLATFSFFNRATLFGLLAQPPLHSTNLEHLPARRAHLPQRVQLGLQRQQLRPVRLGRRLLLRQFRLKRNGIIDGSL